MLELILSVCISFILSSIPGLEQHAPDTQIPTYISSTQPYLTAKSSLLFDINSQQILYSQNPQEKLPIASLTKLVTANIIIEEHQLDEVVTIPIEATQIGGSTMYLRAGERITVENLLKGLIINSANDAAIALSIHNAETTDKFVEKMNQYANQLQMNNSHFSNPMGYDSPENYSTAEDLLKITLKTIQNPTLTNFASIQTTTAQSIDQTITHNLKNTNLELSNFQQINGLKTGTTNTAGQCLITTTNSEQPQVSIIIGSSNRFQDTKTMLDWAKNNIKY